MHEETLWVKNKTQKSTNNPFKKGLLEDIQMTDTYMRRCSISLSHQRNANQNHNELPLYTYQSGFKIITSAGEYAGNLEYSDTAGGNVKW